MTDRERIRRRDTEDDVVVVEFTRPDVVMENLATWRSLGLNAVVGTSGFDDAKLAALRDQGRVRYMNATDDEAVAEPAWQAVALRRPVPFARLV